LRVLSSCYWPGNVRELENCVERTATMAQGDTITDLAFPCKENRCLTQVLHHIDRGEAAPPPRLADIAVVEIPTGPAGTAPAGGSSSAPVPASAPASAGPAAPADFADSVPSSFMGLPDDENDKAGDGKPEGERERLIWAMERCGWVQAKAARLLKISPRQMGYALQKYGIEVRKF